MAEKGFGVKEVNLIGASGTPTITSPNNLNLNAVNVAISTNATVGGTLAVTGSVSIGGTLTYEDVTSIDSVGIITARAGIKMTGGSLFVGGNSNFTGTLTGTATTAVTVRTTDESSDTTCFPVFTTAATGDQFLKTGTNLAFNSSNGTLTATTFSGSGASLTSLPAANLTGTLPAISGANLTNLPADTPTNSDIQVAYTVTANGASAYRFAGNGIVSTEDNPDVYLIRGLKYRFINNSGGSHPFQIRGSSGGSAYSSGVTNNGAASGNIDFQVPYSAPSRLYYQCTAHPGMVGNLYIRGAGGQNDNVGVTTFSGFNHIKTAVINTAYQTIESTATNSYPYLRLKNDAREYQLSCHGGQSDSFNIYDGTAAAYRFTIASTGQVRIGNTNNLALWGQNNRLQVAGTDWNTSGITIACMGNSGSSNLVMGNSRASTPGGSGSVLTSGDRLGYISFVGDDGTDMATVGAAIVAETDGNSSSNSVPGDLQFYTGGNTSGNERIRITSSGYVHFGNTGHGTNKVGGQNITGQDYDPYLKILANTSNHWLMQARSDVTSGNGIFLRSGNSSSTYTLYATGYDENNLHLSVRGDGVIQSPKQVGFAVRMSSNLSHPGNNSFNSGTSWVMPFDTEVWDIGGNFNTSNYTFTAPVAGRYLSCNTIQIETITNWLWLYIYPVVTGTGGTSNTNASTAAGVVFSDAGGTGVTGNSTTTAAYQTFSNTIVMNLTAGQQVRLGTRGQISGTIKSGAETQWTMQLLG